LSTRWQAQWRLPPVCDFWFAGSAMKGNMKGYVSMLQPPNMTFHELDPLTREYRVSFLKAVEKFMPSVLRDLDAIFLRRFSGTDLDRALSKWAQHHHMYRWTLEIARRTTKRWAHHPRTSRTTWKLPPVQTAAVWDVSPFSFNHRGYHPHMDGDLQVYAETLSREFNGTLASHIRRLQSTKDDLASKQSTQTLYTPKRSRDGRDKYIGFEWLAMRLAGTSPAMIAREDEVDPAAVVRQIKWAHSVLSIE
jgi:hypothetical protein